ncbi:nad dependent epimerase dehydratase [Colletotrichum scovillei]|uniref:Nad dependent epimerase dehydratase n=1 Tax=Colletotrichum scovillei TaxID=1209932 RepID=A0A9P7RFF2_9PEZI|nr:nad dependent epimerase dehydratase [Colletotrichum scovillei]KAG7076125.1 nad dependent epimerase dehydratase [Colletotrichum scovillei]KAG7083259.1 nad dependent epimerase dehydratase [Colletotrichum scovillei]
MTMDSPKETGEDASSTSRSFAPLLVEDRKPLKEATQFKLTKFRQRLWDRRQWKNASLTAWEDFRLRLWNRRQWKEALVAAFRDIRAVHWYAVLAWILALAWIGGLCTVLAFISNAELYGDSACKPDGSFDVEMNQYNLWSSSGFFQITLAWGRFSFADAKVIDVAWDVIFGRGGQALLTWITWRVFADYTTTSIQVKPVTYDFFRNIFLQDQPNFWSTWHMIRDFARSRGLRSKLMMVIMVLVTIFILCFPTLGSAMTGYVANNDAYVQGSDGMLIPFDGFEVVGYVIHDGWRIAMEGNTTLTFPGHSSSNTYSSASSWARLLGCIEDDKSYSDYASSWWNFDESTPKTQRCSLHRNVSNYVQEYGFYGLRNENTTWMNKTIPAPALNISASGLPSYRDLIYGWNWTDPRTGLMPFQDENNLTYTAGNETYSKEYMKAYGSCQPMSDHGLGADAGRESYQWGFSYLQLYILVLLLVLWTLSLAYMWLKARLTMRMRRRYDVPRGYKGVLELSGAIRKELQETDPDELSHDQLSEEINKSLKGGRIQLELADSPATYSFWRAIWMWFKEEKWWIGPVLLMLAPSVPLTLINNSFGWWLLVPMSSLLLALMVGRSEKSRIVIALVGFIIGTITFLGVWYGTESYRCGSLYDCYYYR